MPGYEDVWYYLWKERRLPIKVDPLGSQPEDPEERRRLAKIFEQGLGRVDGYALPLRKDRETGAPRWESGPWSLRREHLFLLPGDSPMVLRLPLDSLPLAAPEDLEPLIELDPFAPREPLPPRGEQDRPRRPVAPGAAPGPRYDVGPSRAPDRAAGRSAAGLVRTALCVESREGRLYVFMPPQKFLEGYLELVSTVEATARELRLPILFECFEPPSNHRLNHLSVTPDPGVIEVNLHPAHSWGAVVESTTTLYEEAHQTRLGTEKFMLDGRHSGTGGGNHVVIGGPSPEDSPILRRPDLLRSLVAFCHNHPSLSYLFSGLFVGPTSQAPRLDEARNDSLYELEIAFDEIPSRAAANIHRTEISIDKLYSPDGPTGRLGLVEFRGFEMPPHAEMSLAQSLLLRA